jgi:hypothetical protein
MHSLILPVENTLKMLYSAQQHHHDQSQHHEQISQQTTTSQLAMASSRSLGQRSLHAFWKIPSPATLPDMLPPPIEKAALALANGQASCEDCGTRIPANEDDTLMEIDGYPDITAGASQCVACAKVVCGSCSVSNMGADPRCLVCAGRRDVRWSREQGISAC